MPEEPEFKFKKDWQKHYSDSPYTETHGESEGTFEGTAKSVSLVLERIGVLERMQSEPQTLFFSSVSRGDRDWAVLSELDGKIKTDLTHKVIAGDFAAGIKYPPKSFKHFDYNPLVVDSYELSLASESINVVCERFGAIIYATKEGEHAVRKILSEYRRVLKKDGLMVLDYKHFHPSLNYSTIQQLEEHVGKPKRESGQKVIEENGFEFVGMEGDEEKYMVFRKA